MTLQILPAWFRQEIPPLKEMKTMRGFLETNGLHTVCQQARCPNQGECWGKGVATFMILGARCTRACRFCAVTSGVPEPVDSDEPRRVAEAVRCLALAYVVVTSVTRDDLDDGGADLFCRTVTSIRAVSPSTKIELLTPDFKGRLESFERIVHGGADVLGFNMETVRRLYPRVRGQSDYERSLEVLRAYKRLKADGVVKSGLMVGLGETRAEVEELMRDIRDTGCDLLTIGQYLSPGDQDRHVRIERFWSPDEFDALRATGEAFGFAHVAAGPLVRSSFLAEQGFLKGKQTQEQEKQKRAYL